MPYTSFLHPVLPFLLILSLPPSPFLLSSSSFSVSSTAIDCGSLPNPLNGMVDLSGGTMLGSEATYSCMAGYQLEGNSTRLCTTAGEWHPEAPTCARSSKLSLRYTLCSLIHHSSKNTTADSLRYYPCWQL